MVSLSVWSVPRRSSLTLMLTTAVRFVALEAAGSVLPVFAPAFTNSAVKKHVKRCWFKAGLICWNLAASLTDVAVFISSVTASGLCQAMLLQWSAALSCARHLPVVLGSRGPAVQCLVMHASVTMLTNKWKRKTIEPHMWSFRYALPHNTGY